MPLDVAPRAKAMKRRLRRTAERLLHGETRPWAWTLAAPLLEVASWGYAAGMRMDQRVGHMRPARRPQGPGRWTVSVGNVSVGGNGKTPMVELLVRAHAGRRALVLTRGYGADEDRQLRRELPDSAEVGVGRDRAANAARAVRRRPDIDLVVLDDGLQHWAMQRDVDVVMVNALRPWPEHMLPRGSLREPWADALCRAHAVVVHNADLVTDAELVALEDRLRPLLTSTSAGLFRSRLALQGFRRVRAGIGIGVDADTVVAEDCKGGLDVELLTGTALPKPYVALCGIGCPEAFRESLRRMERGRAGPAALFDFPDHHHFSDEELSRVRADALRDHDARTVVTTSKDAARCGGALARTLDECFVAVSALQIMGGQRKEQEFLQHVRQPPPH